MNRRLLASLASLALCTAACGAAAPASAEDTASTAASPTAPAKPAANAANADANKMVCKREEVTGSNFPAHICHTKAEWEAIAQRRDQENQQYFRNDRLPGSRCGNRPC